jgi:hypothetical protein
MAMTKGEAGREEAEMAPPAGRQSILALIALVLAILGLAELPQLLVLALALGIVSLVQIYRSQGRLRGRVVAIAAIVIPAVVLLTYVKALGE